MFITSSIIVKSLKYFELLFRVFTRCLFKYYHEYYNLIFFSLSYTSVGYVTFKNVRPSDYRYSPRHKHGVIYTRIVIMCTR